MIRPRRWATAGLVGAALLLAPAPTAAPVAVSLVRPDTAKAVDFEDGVVWVLALGSDAQGPDPLDGNADAIELIALDLETGAGTALGIPRDTWVDVDGYKPAKINSALLVGGPDLMATEVEQLTGIPADYVLTVGSAGFAALVDEIGGVTVRSDIAFEDPESGLEVVVGRNPMDGAEAVSYARFRVLEGDDFTRAANHQRLLEAILSELRLHEDDEGFMEGGALAAVQHLETTLSPVELYRFAQAVTQVEPQQVDTCVLTGPTGFEGAVSVVYLDPAMAQRVAADAADDAVLANGCP